MSWGRRGEGDQEAHRWPQQLPPTRAKGGLPVKVLVLGSGGREHAIVHALRRSPGVEEIYAAPGNPGIAQIADLLAVGPDDLPALADAAADLRIDLTVVGPELPLALGIADEFAQRGLRLFGPSQRPELRGSKVFAKQFCLRTGSDRRCRDRRPSIEAAAAARRRGFPLVMKADGLAAGKGVVVVRNKADLESAIDAFFISRRFGDAAGRVLVEECLEGTEVSYMVISDGTDLVPIATSHDYKRALDGDQGPNTGGMGAHSPALVIPPGASRHILDTIVQPTIRGMAEEGREYRGVLYVGLMLTDRGPSVLEFNCRFGDPETQAILLRLDDNLAEVARHAADGRLDVAKLSWRREAAVCVVLAAAGYPGMPRKGDAITGIDAAQALSGLTVYHSGTKLADGELVTAGGRVLSVCALRPRLAAASIAYQGSPRSLRGHALPTRIGADTLAALGGGSGEPG
jgi:phosphoribosylamine--glycine ligase